MHLLTGQILKCSVVMMSSLLRPGIIGGRGLAFKHGFHPNLFGLLPGLFRAVAGFYFITFNDSNCIPPTIDILYHESSLIDPRDN